MKKILLLTGLLIAALGVGIAQTTYADFETVNPQFWGFGNNSNGAIADNPDATGVNTSAKVGTITRGTETWSGNAVPMGGTIDFSPSDTTISLDVYSSVTGDINLKLESGTSVGDIELIVPYTTANAWQTLEFNFPDTLKADYYNQIVLFFDFNGTAVSTWYFDNITGPSATFGSDVIVSLEINDKLSMASTVSLNIEGEAVALTQSGNLWTSTDTLAPYNIVDGGGEYECIVLVDDANYDTVKIAVAGTSATMTWKYLLLDETPEDGTADAISVGSTPPTIDGDIDAVWSNAPIHPLQKRDWWGSPTGLYATYKIMWDIDNVYVLVSVDDETLYNSGADPWENDNIEMYFDMNQSATTPYDGDDYQFRTIRGLDTYTGSANVDAAWGTNVTRAQKAKANDAGYVVEVAIPWSSLSVSFLPLATKKFNFDISVADVADNGGRDYIISWNTAADNAYNNTENFGVITLSASTGATSIVDGTIENLNIYPVPANNILNINAGNILSSVAIYDITGKSVLSSNEINATNTILNVSNLTNGIYILKVNDIEGNTITRKINIQ